MEKEYHVYEKLDIKFIENMKEMLGNNFDKYKKALGEPAIRGLRVNPLKIEKADFLSVFPYALKQVPYEENGFVLLSNEKLGNSPYHISGMIYMQEPSSMLAVASVEIEKGDKVLDMCAAPGGKSTQIASKLKDGLIVSNEIVLSRAKILFSNIERLGVENSVILNETPENIANKLPGFFDIVFVDAPCSGEGMFRKDPDTIKEWSDERIRFNHDRQIDILRHADKTLKVGGKLVYSTCTFSLVEDEEVVIDFLKEYGYKVVDVLPSAKQWTEKGFGIDEARRFFPYSGKGEGQFVCVLEKQSGNYEDRSKPKIKTLQGREKQLITDIINANFVLPYEFELISMHDSIMLVTSDMLEVCFGKLNVINAGIRLGSIEKNNFKPHHQMFTTLGKYALHKKELDDETLKKYVHGEELEGDSGLNGKYICMCYRGASLGGAKCTNGRLKNLYPKGLRI